MATTPLFLGFLSVSYLCVTNIFFQSKISFADTFNTLIFVYFADQFVYFLPHIHFLDEIPNLSDIHYVKEDHRKRKPEGFLFATTKVAYVTAMILINILHIILQSAVHIYNFHIFITSRYTLHNQCIIH